MATPDLAREAFFSEELPGKLLLKYWEQTQDDSFRAFLDMAALDLPRPAKVKIPLLVLGAERDNMLKRSEIEAAARAYNTRLKSSQMWRITVCLIHAGRPWQTGSWFG